MDNSRNEIYRSNLHACAFNIFKRCITLFSKHVVAEVAEMAKVVNMMKNLYIFFYFHSYFHDFCLFSACEGLILFKVQKL